LVIAPCEMSSSEPFTSAHGRSTDRPLLKKTNFSLFFSDLNTSVKTAPGNGQRAAASLSVPRVDEIAFDAFTVQQRARHLDDDGVLAKALSNKEILAFKDKWRVSPYLGNVRVNPLPLDPTTNNGAKPWWCSPARAALDKLSADFAGCNDDDVSNLKTALMAVNLERHRGDFNTFEEEFSNCHSTYMTAAQTAGRDVNALDSELAVSLIAQFDSFDKTKYGVTATLQRQTPGATVQRVLKAFRMEYDNNPIAPSPPAHRVLVTEEKAAKDSPWSVLATALARMGQGGDRGGNGRAKSRDQKPQREPVDEVKMALCKAQKACYNFAVRRDCHYKNCSHEHKSWSAIAASGGSNSANVVDTLGYDFTLLTVTCNEEAVFSHEGKHEDLRDNAVVDVDDAAVDDTANGRSCASVPFTPSVSATAKFRESPKRLEIFDTDFLTCGHVERDCLCLCALPVCIACRTCGLCALCCVCACDSDYENLPLRSAAPCNGAAVDRATDEHTLYNDTANVPTDDEYTFHK
jgi:hypothetical protein